MTIVFLADSRSPYVAKEWPGERGSNGVRYCSFHVRFNAPSVRPWKLLEKETVSVAHVVASASAAMAFCI